MNAHHATPTAVLLDLIVERSHYSNVPLEYYDRYVAVALWAPAGRDMTEDEWIAAVDAGADVAPDARTALAIMSAALYVRLYPKGHHGPTVLDGGAE